MVTVYYQLTQKNSDHPEIVNKDQPLKKSPASETKVPPEEEYLSPMPGKIQSENSLANNSLPNVNSSNAKGKPIRISEPAPKNLIESVKEESVSEKLVAQKINKEVITAPLTNNTTSPDLISKLQEKNDLKSIAKTTNIKTSDQMPEQAYAVNDDVHILYFKASTLRNTKLGNAFTKLKKTIEKTSNLGKQALVN